MNPDTRSGAAIGKGVIMAVLMFVFIMLSKLLPFDLVLAQRPILWTIAFCVMFGLVMALFEWVTWPRKQRDLNRSDERR